MLTVYTNCTIEGWRNSRIDCKNLSAHIPPPDTPEILLTAKKGMLLCKYRYYQIQKIAYNRINTKSQAKTWSLNNLLCNYFSNSNIWSVIVNIVDHG